MKGEKRKRSSWGLYHVILRCQKEDFLFGDDEDCAAFLQILDMAQQHREKDWAPIMRFRIYAYCIMKNHAHILIRRGVLDVAESLKSISVNYSCYYNKKYDKWGEVFFGRYLSDPIESHETLFKIFAFIHNHPVNEGLCTNWKDYEWTSWKEYFKKGTKKICDTRTILNLRPKEQLLALIEENSPVECTDVDKRERKLHDSVVIEMLREMAKCKLPTTIPRMAEEKKMQLALKAVEKGANPYQVARLCDLSLYKLKKELGK